MSEQRDIYREHMMHARISSEQEAYQAELERKRATQESSPGTCNHAYLVDGHCAICGATQPPESSPADGVERAMDCDTAALWADNEALIGLLLLRHSALLKVTDDHPHKDSIKQARESAQRELLWRMRSTELLDWWEHHEEYIVGFAPSGDWSGFDKAGHTCYGKTIRACLAKLQDMHADISPTTRSET